MALRFEGRSVLVTGAASGIGRSTAQRFAGEGARVTCADVDASGLAETVEGIEKDGGSASAVHCDVADADSARSAVAGCADAAGLDVLCNVAGIGSFEHSEKLADDDWDRIIAVNLSGTFHMTRAALPHLLASENGCVVNTASLAGLVGQAYNTAYCASKWGVIGMTKAMAVEYAKRGLRVNCVCPGGVNTPIIRTFKIPEDADQSLIDRMSLVLRPSQPEEIADAIVFLASDSARSINGVALPVDKGTSAG